MPVHVERRDRVLVLTIDRPEVRNALDAATIDALADGIEQGERDPDVRALVLTAAGDRAFCAGMDLKAHAAGPPAYRNFGTYQRFKREGAAKPVVAAVNGAAVGGGLELVLACDMAVAAEHATFALPEVRRGLFAAGGGMVLGRRVPRAVALEIGLTGAPLDARRAYEVGLVNRVTPAGRTLAAALELAGAVAANGPRAVAVTRRLMASAAHLSDAQLWAANDAARPEVFDSDDAWEGTRAFVEHRPPRWTGT